MRWWNPPIECWPPGCPRGRVLASELIQSSSHPRGSVMWNQLERFGGGSLWVRRRWTRVLAVGAAAAMLAAGVVAVPGVPVASAAPVESGSNGAFLTLTVDSDDVECLDNRVVIDAMPTGEPGQYSSSLSFNEVPDGWFVRSSWEVTTGGAGGPQTVSLGSVATPVSDPLGPGGPPLPDAPYVDDVAFGGIVDAGDEFTYTATLQLFDTGETWSSGLQLSIECGSGEPVVNVENLAAEVQPLPSTLGASIEPAVIDWELCDPDDVGSIEECGTITVPLDHFSGVGSDVGGDDPVGTTIEVAVSRFPATSGNSKGALVVNPGGPGRSGFDLARGVRFIYADSLGRDYDIVGMDPRGVGESSPAPYCATPPTPSNGLSNILAPVWSEFFSFAQPLAAAANSVCSAATARYLGFLGTRQVAADMDWIRRAEDLRRGEPKPLAYFGGSYGTRLGTVYLSQSGDNAGSFVLTGAVDPSVTYAGSMTDRTGPPDEVFADLFVPAAPEGIGQKFDAVVAALTPVGPTSQEPEVAAVVDGQQTTVTQSGFLSTVLTSLRSEPGWPALVEYISDTFDVVVDEEPMAQIATPDVPEFGDPLPVDPSGSGRIGFQPTSPVGAASPGELRSGLNQLLIQNVVNCLDLPGVPATAADMTAEAEAVVPGSPPNELGWPFLAALQSCSGLSPSGVDVTKDTGGAKVWPLSPPPGGTQAPLVIGSEGDTPTPYEWSVALNEFFTDQQLESRLLTYDGAEHAAGFVWPPTSCVRDAVIDVFATGDLPGPNELNCDFYSPFPRTPPTNVAGTPGDQTVTLTWELSTQRLGGTVEGFGVELRVVDPAPADPGVQGGGDDDWDIIEDGSCAPDVLGPTDTTCVVSDLVNGTSYEFRMVTLPALRSPLFSESTGPITPQAPPTPPSAPLVMPGVGQVEVTVPSGGDVGFVPVRWEVVASPGEAQCEVDRKSVV